jgi:putative ABC transport system permease protein
MRIGDTIRRAGRSLRQAKARTLLTSLAIGVGAFTITLSLAAGSGGRQYAQNLIAANTDVHQIQVQARQDDTPFSSSQPREYSDTPSLNYGNGFRMDLLNQADIDKLAKIDGVASVEPNYTLDVQYVTRPGQKKYQASVSMFSSAIKQEYVAGNADHLTRTSIVIPESYREVLGFTDNQAAVGQTIDLSVQRGAAGSAAGMQQPEAETFQYTIAAVFKSNELAFNNSTSMQINNEAAKEVYDFSKHGTPEYGRYIAAMVYVRDDVDNAAVKSRIEAAGKYTSRSAEDIMGTLFNFINVLQGILLGFGALAVLTSIFGIINTQYISVLERTQQIGLMKALGMRRRDVGRLFKFEAAWIGFLGGAIGSGLAVIAGTVANPAISKALSLDGIGLLIFSPLPIAGVIVGLMVVAVTAGILPARKAAKLDPIEALRTE